jgi:cytochrome oxidase Cu insertion factor (SCO1/SenC/PrrC family)
MQQPVGLVDRDIMKHHIATILLAAAVASTAVPASGDDEMIQPGMPFPAFELPAHDGTTVSSADLEGSTFLLFFYPKANTGG